MKHLVFVGVVLCTLLMASCGSDDDEDEGPRMCSASEACFCQCSSNYTVCVSGGGSGEFDCTAYCTQECGRSIKGSSQSAC